MFLKLTVSVSEYSQIILTRLYIGVDGNQGLFSIQKCPLNLHVSFGFLYVILQIVESLENVFFVLAISHVCHSAMKRLLKAFMATSYLNTM